MLTNNPSGAFNQEKAPFGASFFVIVKLKALQDTHTPLGSNSAQDVMNSPRWWEPRMEESRVR